MGAWGEGLLQSDGDYDIAADLEGTLGFPILQPTSDEEPEILDKLNSGLLAQTFDKILGGEPLPYLDGWSRKRTCVVLAILAMQIGAKMQSRHIGALRDLRNSLPNMVQQLQLLTALDGYRNDGTRWILGSKGLVDTANAKAQGKTEYDNGDEFWFGGLGHSADEDPYPHMWSKRCLACRSEGPELLHCTRCNMAQYCNKQCQARDWTKHRAVCCPAELRSVCIPDLGTDEFKDSGEVNIE